MRTSSQRLAAVRKREAMLLASVNCSSRCLNLGSYLRRGGGAHLGFKPTPLYTGPNDPGTGRSVT